jgi:hypothetical protein
MTRHGLTNKDGSSSASPAVGCSLLPLSASESLPAVSTQQPVNPPFLIRIRFQARRREQPLLDTLGPCRTYSLLLAAAVVIRGAAVVRAPAIGAFCKHPVATLIHGCRLSSRSMHPSCDACMHIRKGWRPGRRRWQEQRNACAMHAGRHPNDGHCVEFVIAPTYAIP